MTMNVIAAHIDASFPDFTNIGAINATVSSCDTISAIAAEFLAKLCRSAGWKVGNHQNMLMSN